MEIPQADPAPLPRQQLDARIVAVWRIKLGLFLGVVFLAASAYDILNLFDEDAFLRPGVASGLCLVIAIAASLWIPRFRHRFWWYRLTDEELVLERGIINRILTIVPLRRVQHIDVSQDLIEREYELGKLIVHTAGTRSSEVVLPGLPFERAEALRDRIKAYIHDEPV